MKKFFAAFLAVLIFIGLGNVFAAASEPAPAEPSIVPAITISPIYLPRPTPILNPPGEDDVIDFSRFEGKTFEEITNDFFEEWGIDPEDLSFGYYNTVTGEELYHNGDKYMVAASVYKLPLNMYYTEKIYNGEISWEDRFAGSPYHAVQVSSIISSNNELSEALQKAVGDNNAYRDAIAYLLDVDTATVEEEYYNTENKYTARQIIASLKKLYGNRHIYVNVEEYMLMAAPNSHFTAIEHRYTIPHKYGYLSYNGHNYYNDAAIAYTPHPILLVMFTDNCAGGSNTLTRFCTLMCDYSEYTRYLYEEAAKATPTPSPSPEEPEETELLETPAEAEPTATPEIEETPEPTEEVQPIPTSEPGNEPEKDNDNRVKFTGLHILFVILAAAAIIAAVVILKKKKKGIDSIIMAVALIILSLALVFFISIRAQAADAGTYAEGRSASVYTNVTD